MNTGIQNGSAGPTEEPHVMLPYQEPLKTWAGRGTGATCDVCHKPIRAQEVEYEIEVAPLIAGRNLRFHLPCYKVWEMQRRDGE